MNLKTSIILLLILTIFSCNRKQHTDISSNKIEITKKYAELQDEKNNTDIYEDIIPILENALHEFESEDTIVNKIKLDLASYYILDHVMVGKDSSFNKSKELFLEVLEYDSKNEFLTKVLELDPKLVDTIRANLYGVEINKEGVKYLFETLEKISAQL